MDRDMNGLLERLLDEAEGGSPPGAAGFEGDASAPAGASGASPVPSGGGGNTGGGNLPLSPSLLTALPVLAENLGPLMGGLAGGGVRGGRSHGPDRHTALLCAIKPYLSPRRQEAVETVIRLCRVWDALEKAGISPLGLLNGIGNAFPVFSSAPEGSPAEPRDREVT